MVTCTSIRWIGESSVELGWYKESMTPVAAKVDSLRSLPLFEGLAEASLRKIAQLATEVEIPRGQMLLQPNVPGTGMFIIEEGTVTIELPRRRLELGPGETIGELSLLIDIDHTARVRAQSDIRCLAINRDDFRRLVKEEPKMALALIEVLARRLADSSKAV